MKGNKKMKKLAILLVACALVSACENMSKYTTVGKDATDQERVRACLINEATAKFEAGTLFEGELKATAKTITNTCLTKLALQKAGITEETQSAATEIISSFKNLTSK